MATRVPTTADVRHEYFTTDDWDEIERAAGVTFSPDIRNEIDSFYNLYNIELEMNRNAPLISEINEFRNSILFHANSILDIWKLDGYSGKAWALRNMRRPFEGKDFRDMFFDTALSLTRLVALIDPQKSGPDRLSPLAADIRSPEAAALNFAIARITELDAGGKSLAERWGLEVGRRNVKFRAFLEKALRRQITEDELSNAMKKTRQAQGSEGG